MNYRNYTLGVPAMMNHDLRNEARESANMLCGRGEVVRTPKGARINVAGDIQRLLAESCSILAEHLRKDMLKKSMVGCVVEKVQAHVVTEEIPKPPSKENKDIDLRIPNFAANTVGFWREKAVEVLYHLDHGNTVALAKALNYRTRAYHDHGEVSENMEIFMKFGDAIRHGKIKQVGVIATPVGEASVREFFSSNPYAPRDSIAAGAAAQINNTPRVPEDVVFVGKDKFL